MKVIKFGGSSVGTPARIKNVLDIVLEESRGARNFVVVVSAFEGCTDLLLRIGKTAAQGGSVDTLLADLKKRHLEAVRELLTTTAEKTTVEVELMFADLGNVVQGISLVREASLKTLDLLMSFGERLSAKVIAKALGERVPAAEFVDSRSLIVTDASYSSAKVDFAKTNEKITSFVKQTPGILVVTGFIAATPGGETTTLGRGGSDYTVSIWGAALQAEEIQIWTDVDGVMTADPRKVKGAFPLPMMTYEEAMELSHFGAKVIYPPTIQPALMRKIPIRVKNTFNPGAIGTVITAERPPSEHPVSGISSISAAALMRVQGSGMIGVAGIASRLFGALAANSISVILISQASSEHSICLAVHPQSAPLARETLLKEFELEIAANQIDEVVVEDQVSIVAVVGADMRRSPGIAGRVFQAMGRNGINIRAIAQGSSELNISLVINAQDETKALNALHDAFFLSEEKTINIFLIGPGNVGSELLRQFAAQQGALKHSKRVDLRLAGLANSKKMLFDPNGVALNEWSDLLDRSTKPFQLVGFLDEMKRANLPNSIFIDCSADEEIANSYEDVLSHSISIVTPNKRANSATLATYRRLHELAARKQVKFYYETNVGAALPVISTLSDLLASGDEVIRIEAVLSGTLSYIFNTFSEGRTFSEVVTEAKKRGYTEPDPRDDLSGQDVARKVLILGREMGLSLELSDVQVESLVPESCRALPSSDTFLTELAKSDGDFEARRAAAAMSGRSLRYIARIENGRASIALGSVAAEHPFAKLSGADNMVVFTTKRYSDRPLVVSGPGAGIEVTAAGVFADLLRVVSYLT